MNQFYIKDKLMNSLNIIELVEKSDKAYALAMVPSDVLKKYTEAIVRECISLANDVCLGDEAGEHGDTVSLVVGEIERHFGIKS
jgi:hypothetical protein